MIDETDDPILEAQVAAEIERAIAPVKDTLPREVLDELRLTLRLGLLYNPSARALLDELRPTAAVNSSGKVATAAFKNRKKAKNGGGQ